MVTYNYFNASNVTKITEMIKYADYVSEYTLGTIWILAFFVITITIFSQRYDTKSAFLASSMLCALFTIFFRLIGIMNDLATFVVIAVALVALAICIKSGR